MQFVQNPWGLTKAQADVMDAVCDGCCTKATAKRLGISTVTVSDHLKQAYLKLGVNRMLAAGVKWDRWRRPKGEDLPTPGVVSLQVTVALDLSADAAAGVDLTKLRAVIEEQLKRPHGQLGVV